MLSTYSKHGFKKTESVTIPEVKDFLHQKKNRELGVEKKNFKKFCGDKDLSELEDLYEMECQL